MDRLLSQIHALDREIDRLRADYLAAMGSYSRRRDALVEQLATSGRLIEQDVPHDITQEVMVDG